MILWALSVIFFIVGVYGAIDAAVRPFAHWQRTGYGKAGWIVAQLLVLIPIANLAGFAAAVVYLTRVRPKLKAAAEELPTF